MHLRTLLVLTTLGALSAEPAWAAPVDDATRTLAHSLGEEGIVLFDQGDFKGALEKFVRALSLVEAPTLALRAGRCLERLGRLVEAAEKYRLAGAMAIDAEAPSAFRAGQAEAQRQATDARAALIGRIAKMKLRATSPLPPQAILALDGKTLPDGMMGVEYPIDPGPHVLHASAPGWSLEQPFTADPGQIVDVTLEVSHEATANRVALAEPLAPTKPADTAAPIVSTGAQPPTLRTLGWIGVGVGGATLIVGGSSWLVARGLASDLENSCRGGSCSPDQSDAVGRYQDYRLTAIVASSVGAALLSTGVVLLLIQPTAKHDASFTPWVTASGAGVRGSF